MSAKTAQDSVGPIIDAALMCGNVRTVNAADGVGQGADLTTLAARFWSKVDRKSASECWLWTGCFDSRGYGQIKFNTRKLSAHRVSWELVNKQAPGARIVRHSCDTPACVNPAHLLIGTHGDNVADRVRRGRSAKGMRNGRSVLTPVNVIGIRDSKLPPRVIAPRHGVSVRTVIDIRNGKTWKHLKGLRAIDVVRPRKAAR